MRADLEAGEVGRPVLLGTTAYVVITALMVFAVLVLHPAVVLATGYTGRRRTARQDVSTAGGLTYAHRPAVAR